MEEVDAELHPAARVLVKSAPGQNGVLALINVAQLENRKGREQEQCLSLVEDHVRSC